MARRFRFDLEPVRKYREMIEDAKRRDFAAANRQVEEQRLRLEEMGEERQHTQDEIRKLYAGGAAFNQVIDTYRFINTLEMQLARGQRQLAAYEQVREQKRGVFVAARRDREALDILKRQRQEEFRREQERRDQAGLDELAIIARRQRLHEAQE